MKGYREKIINPGSDGYLNKPFSRKELIAVLEEYINYKQEPTEQKSPGVKTDAESKISCENLNELLEILNGKYRTNSESIRKTIILWQINTFDRAIVRLGKQYNVSVIKTSYTDC